MVLIFWNLPSSPQVAGLSTSFRFGLPDDVLSQASASHSDLGQLASQGGTTYTNPSPHTHTLVLPSVFELTVLIFACSHLHLPSQLFSQTTIT